jgi:hypothetical protein
MRQQMRQNAVDFLLHSLEIHGALYLFYIALWLSAVKKSQFFSLLLGRFCKWALETDLQPSFSPTF